MTAKYILGIDLGTTNSVLSYAALDTEAADVKLLDIPQHVSASTIESRTSLPSFTYLGTVDEGRDGAFNLPWAEARTFAVGRFAQDRAAEAPDRTIGAAKSWLCHQRVDRRQPILPWNAPDEVDKISPVTASQVYLEHLVAAWEDAFPDAPISDQQVVLTVPASFDPVARELTREAATAAGLPAGFVLLEEPQAALYAWLATTGDDWRKMLKVNETVLVCDIGGGTTDLTLVRVTEEAGTLALERVAVGNHLLVGGDNMDLTLAHVVATEFDKQGVKLNPWQSVSLWHSCRAAKESLLAEGGPEKQSISVLGRGSKLIGGTVSVEVRSSECGKLASRWFSAPLFGSGPSAETAGIGLSGNRAALRIRSRHHASSGRFFGGTRRIDRELDFPDACAFQRWRIESRHPPITSAGGDASVVRRQPANQSPGRCSRSRSRRLARSRLLWMGERPRWHANSRRCRTLLLRRHRNSGPGDSRSTTTVASVVRRTLWNGRRHAMRRAVGRSRSRLRRASPVSLLQFGDSKERSSQRRAQRLGGGRVGGERSVGSHAACRR